MLASNRYITDDFGPVYRAVVNFKLGWDIYNEHFDYVDPHYLYPPGGTLIMAPFGYLPGGGLAELVHLLQYACDPAGRLLPAAAVQLHVASVAAPALLLAMFCTENVTNTLGSATSTAASCCWRCCSSGGCWTANAATNGGRASAIGLTLVVKPLLAPLLLLPLLNRQWRCLVTAFLVPVVFNAAAWPLISDPMSFVTRTVPYIFSTRDYFNSSHPGQRRLLRTADVADPAAARRSGCGRRSVAVAAVPATTAPGTRCSGC